MRKYIYMVLSVFFLAACEKEDVLEYQLSEDCIQFGFDAEEMEMEYNFAEQRYTELGSSGRPIYKYSGDSLLCDTLELPLSIIGWENENAREFKLKLVPVVELDTLPLAEVILDPSYSFQANERKDTIRVIFMRPEAGERVAAGITFDIEGQDAVFGMGAEELSVYNLIVENVYEQSTNWDEAYLGEFSQAKAAFIVTTLQTKLSEVSDWSAVNLQLRKVLEEYNAEHLDAPKDFTIPVNTKPGWWDNNTQWLGEYSEEKEAFIKEKVGVWSQNVNWATYSLVLGYWYDQDPDATYSFPRSDFRVVEEPDWWAANQQWLGVFSIEKAIFFEQGLYLGTGIWESGADYPWADNISYIKQQYEYYFYNPLTQPYFKDDFVVPAGTAPSWWAYASGYLGAYSEAKKAFMESVLGKDNKEWWDKEAPTVKDWSIYINELIDAYKELEKPEFDNDFDPEGKWEDPGKDDGKGDDKK